MGFLQDLPLCLAELDPGWSRLCSDRAIRSPPGGCSPLKAPPRSTARGRMAQGAPGHAASRAGGVQLAPVTSTVTTSRRGRVARRGGAGETQGAPANVRMGRWISRSSHRDTRRV